MTNCGLKRLLSNGCSKAHDSQISICHVSGPEHKVQPVATDLESPAELESLCVIHADCGSLAVTTTSCSPYGTTVL